MATFGYTSDPSTNYSVSAGDVYGSVFTSPSDMGTVNSVKAYWLAVFGPPSVNAKALIVKHSDLTIVANGISNVVNKANAAGRTQSTFTFATAPTLEASTEYVLCLIADSGAIIYYDTGDADQGHYDSTNSYSSPANLGSVTHSTKKFPILVDYTPSAGSEETAAYTALPITVTLPAMTATAEEEDTAAFSALGVAVTIPSVTASSVELRTAAYTSSSLVVTIPDITAASEEETTANFAPISIKVGVPDVTGSSIGEFSATVSPLSVLAIVPSITGSYVSEVASTFDSVSMTLTIPSLTAVSENVVAASIDPLSVLATIPDVTATSDEVTVAAYTTLIITMTPPSMTASYLAELSAAYDPVSMTVTPIDTTPTITRNRTYISFGTKIEYYVEGQLIEDVG